MSIERLPRLVGAVALVVAAVATGTAVTGAQSSGSGAQGAAGEVTYSKDIAPILQRSCSSCHNPDGGAPMSLTTYEEVRPYARAIKTAHRNRAARRRDAALVRREEHRHSEVTRATRR